MRFFGIFCGMLLLIGCGGTPPPASNAGGKGLDEAVQTAVNKIDFSLGQEGEQKPVFAILNFVSPWEELSDYVLEEITLALAERSGGGGRFVIVDRQRLDLIRQEEHFQHSGAVNDATIQSIGEKLGASHVITGSLTEMGDMYRFRVIALGVETAAIAAPTSVNIPRADRSITRLIETANKRKTDEANAAAKRRDDEASAAAKRKTEEEIAAVKHRDDEAANRVYHIGNTGPGGGIVFLVEGSNAWEVSTLPGTYSYYNDYARSAAKDYRGGGYSDWKLPSIGMLGLIYQNLQKSGIANFGSGSYWSDSRDSNYTYYWQLKFSDGSQNSIHYQSSASVLAVRSFRCRSQ